MKEIKRRWIINRSSEDRYGGNDLNGYSKFVDKELMSKPKKKKGVK